MDEKESYVPEGDRFLHSKISNRELKTAFGVGNKQSLTFSKKETIRFEDRLRSAIQSYRVRTDFC